MIGTSRLLGALGTKVIVIEQRRAPLEFCDSQIVEVLQYHRDVGVVFRFPRDGDPGRGTPGAITHLASGKRIPADAVLYSAGRQGDRRAGLARRPRG